MRIKWYYSLLIVFTTLCLGLFVLALDKASATEAVYDVDLANTRVLYCDGKTAWDVCHHSTDADSASQITANSTSNVVHASKYAVNDWYLRRTELNFDTSALPDDAVIDSAVLTIWSAGTGGDDDDAWELDLIDLTNNANVQNPLATEDMNDIGTGVVGSIDLTSLTNIGANVDIDITDLSVISVNSDTRIGLQMQGDTDDTTPTGINILRISTGSAGDDPYITINYHIGAGEGETASTTITYIQNYKGYAIGTLDPYVFMISVAIQAGFWIIAVLLLAWLYKQLTRL